MWRKCIFLSIVPLLFAYAGLALHPFQLSLGRRMPLVMDRLSLREFTGRVGQPVRYAACFLAQAHEFGPWGTVAVLTVLFIGLYLATRLILRLYNERAAGFLAVVPPALMLVLFKRGLTVWAFAAMVVTLLFAGLYLRFAPERGSLRLLLFTALSAVLAYLVAGPVLVFVVLCALHEILHARRPALGAACLLVGAATPYLVSRWLYEPDLFVVYARSTPWQEIGVEGKSPTVLHYAFYLLVPLAAVATTLQARWRRARSPSPSTRRWTPLSRRVATALGMACVLAAPVLTPFRADEAATWPDLLAREGKWKEMLSFLRALPVERRLISDRHMAARALYHTGRLPYEMFRDLHWQDSSFLLLLGPEYDAVSLVFTKRSDVLFELGRINDSERWTHEALTSYGAHPHILERLARINVLKGRPEAARVFLGVMAKTPHGRRRAISLQRSLAANPAMPDDVDIRRVRPMQLRRDFVGARTLEQLLLQCLDANPRNRMAFEYLMAHYLLTGNLDKFAVALNQLEHFQYPVIPDHYEEAIVTYAQRIGKIPDGLRGRSVRQETISRFQAFCERLALFPGDRKAAWDDLAPEFGATYWFFDVFGMTAAGRSPFEMSGQPGAITGATRREVRE